MSNIHVTAKVNGDDVEFLCDPRETLLDVLRDRLNLTGTKEGCGTGDCGACTVTIEDRLVCSCLMLGVEASGKSIETIEGMAKGDKLHPFRKNLLSMPLCSAVFAHQVFWSQQKIYWKKILTQMKNRCDIG